MAARSRRRRLLVPEARREWDKFKAEVMSRELGTAVQPDEIRLEVARMLKIPLKKEDNGQIRAKDAGKIGGVIGGATVRELVRMAQETMARRQGSDPT
ncbi:small, acid-soluble spore protein, alpha/beta type [Staphylospora marina]|uniref:small, acid-soluble spore protein, alpha/beta type n=1 Tax=Staphylospora marina TaxID=2490858 RepID=UPI001F14C06D|nr:small, acid-soluble spore protein, alpha/beta type [Staphylospora marina]